MKISSPESKVVELGTDAARVTTEMGVISATNGSELKGFKRLQRLISLWEQFCTKLVTTLQTYDALTEARFLLGHSGGLNCG
jgi:hypothetical protein